MMNEKIAGFEKLSPENKEFVKGVIKSLTEEETPEKKAKRQQEKQRREQERIEHENHLAEIKAKCDNMDAGDYRRELNRIFKHMECYKLRYFYVFITETLRS